MQQQNKVHNKRIEYRTVNLVYWNNEDDGTISTTPNLFNLQKIYPGESTGNTFLTRQFDLNLGDKNPNKV